jgi:DNA-binding winged helix-turn-helix (wHTH) protein
MQTAENSTVIRFGPFEADLRTRELRRNGLKLKLQEQPFQVLVMLLERAGELVTREEIRAKLWPQDTFLDFDHGLNAAVRRLREALNDNASLPRFVETLPRRGYRFIAAVQKMIPQGAPQPEALASTISDSPGFIRAMERRVPKPGGADEEGLPAHLIAISPTAPGRNKAAERKSGLTKKWLSRRRRGPSRARAPGLARGSGLP